MISGNFEAHARDFNNTKDGEADSRQQRQADRQSQRSHSCCPFVPATAVSTLPRTTHHYGPPVHCLLARSFCVLQT